MPNINVNRIHKRKIWLWITQILIEIPQKSTHCPPFYLAILRTYSNSPWDYIILGGKWREPSGQWWYSTKFYTRKLCPEVQTLTLSYTIFDRKDNLFIYLSYKMVSLSHTYSRNTASLFGGSVQDILKAIPFKYLNDSFPSLFYTSAHEIPVLYVPSA